MKYKELLKKITAREQMLLVDVREPFEYADLKTNESFINIPMNLMIEKAEKGDLPKDKTIIVVCRSGRRSSSVANILTNNGYDALSLEGGISNF